MSFELTIDKDDSKKERYENLRVQLKYLLQGEENIVATLSNFVAALKYTFDFFWVGFYLKDSPEQLVLGPFQGPVACTRIGIGKGVCGKAWQTGETLIVPNVDNFLGHIACSNLSKSEIVVPIFQNQKVVAVLDVDSDRLNTFDAIDAQHLKQLVEILKF